MNKILCSLLLIIGLSTLLSSCGQTGKLYLPEKTPKQTGKRIIHPGSMQTMPRPASTDPTQYRQISVTEDANEN